MMLVVGQPARRQDSSSWIAEWIIERLHPHHLLPTVIFTSGLLSAFLVNDIVCLVMTPFVLHMARRLRLPVVPYVIAVATASNIGSVGDDHRQPAEHADRLAVRHPYLEFIAHLGPVALAGLFLNWALLHWMYLRGSIDRVASTRRCRRRNSGTSRCERSRWSCSRSCWPDFSPACRRP